MVTTTHPGAAVNGLADLLLVAPDCDAGQVTIAWRWLEEASRSGGMDAASLADAIGMAQILASLHLDTESLCAALLHEAVRCGAVPQQRVRHQFGDTVTALVDGVVRMDTIRDHLAPHELASPEEREGHTESLRKMLVAMVDDVRVVVVKLAARVQAMRGLKHRPAGEQRWIAQETRDIFAPLANRLGIWQFKWELEDLSFRYLEPRTYQELARAVAERRVDRERYLAAVVVTLESELARHGLAAEVSSRPKHLYSIWRKMQRKGVGLDEIFDTRAVRILVSRVADCYAALGIAHGLWQHIPREFDDYIANPKQNDYRSLHTAVVGPEGKALEVQIRTFEMHQHAELGIAAHWRYKEGGGEDGALERKIHWLRQLLEWKDEFTNTEEFTEHFRVDDTDDRVYVFTPRGKIIDLPNGATPLDFAYHIHTDVGHRCRGARVDGKLVPLTQPLGTGCQVEILTTKQPSPSRDWLNQHLGYLKTSRARGKVRHWFRSQDHDQNVADGRSALDRELRRLAVGGIGHDHVARQLKFQHADELYAALGFGDVSTAQVAGAVAQLLDPGRQRGKPAAARRTGPRTAPPKVVIHGIGDLLSQMARCCDPVPGDPVVGFITRGRGVTVHRRDCANILRLEPGKRDRLIEVNWGDEEGAVVSATIRINAYDRTGLLRDITTVLGNEKINVQGVYSATDPQTRIAEIEIRLESRGIEELSRVMARIGELANVREIQRTA